MIQLSTLRRQPLNIESTVKTLSAHIRLLVSSLNNLLFKSFINPTALKKAKIVYNFGLSECMRVKTCLCMTDSKKLKTMRYE